MDHLHLGDLGTSSVSLAWDAQPSAPCTITQDKRRLAHLAVGMPRDVVDACVQTQPSPWEGYKPSTFALETCFDSG